MLTKKILELFHQISNIGVDAQLSSFDKNKVIILNQVAFFTAIVLFYFFINSIFLSIESSLFNFAIALLPFPVFFYNYYKCFKKSIFYGGVIFPVFITIIYMAFGSDFGIEFTYLGFIIINLILFNKDWQRITSIFYILFLNGIGNYYCENYVSIYGHLANPFYKFLVILFTAIGLGIIVMTLYREIERQIIEQEKLNSNLKKANIELKELLVQNEAKNQLFAILAHDLKGPVGAFTNLSKNIGFLIKKEQQDRLLKIADYFEQSADEISYTLDNLLKWVISQKDEINPSFENVNLHDLVEEISEQFNVFCRSKNVFIKNEIPEDLSFVSDPNMLKIILSNIAHNGIKHSENGNTVYFKNNIVSKSIRINVIDNGSGMSNEFIKKAKANKYESNRGNFKTGHGLGLKSCFALIKYLEGKISIESEEKIGTSVSVILPFNKTIVGSNKTKKGRMDALKSF